MGEAVPSIDPAAHSGDPDPSSDSGGVVREWTYSASQIKTFSGCQQKYYYQYVRGLKAPQSPGAALGSAVHAVLEQHYGELPVLDAEACPPELETQARRLAQKIIDVTGPVPEERDVELVDHFELFGKQFVVKIDLVFEDPETGQVVVDDHKTSSDVARYALDAKDLRRDIQALIYAAWAMHRFDVETVDLRWNYVQTKGTSITRATREVLGRAHVANKLEAVRDVVSNIELVRLGRREPQRNLYACDAYGGCPFRDVCKSEMIGKGKEKSMPSFLERQRQRIAEAKAAAPTPAPRPADEAAELRARLAEAEAALAAVRPSEEPAGPSLGVVNPPDGGTRTVTRADIEAAAAEPPKRGRGRPRKNPPPEPPLALSERDAAELARIRAAKAAMTAPAPDLDTPLERQIDREAAALASEIAEATRSATLVGILYVDCIPTRGALPATDVNDLIAMLEPPKEGHFLLAEFGKGPALLELAVRDALEAEPKEALTISSRGMYGRLVDFLASRSAVVIRGLP